MPDTHGGNIFKFSHDHKINLSEETDFSANINLLGPSPNYLDLQGLLFLRLASLNTKPLWMLRTYR